MRISSAAPPSRATVRIICSVATAPSSRRSPRVALVREPFTSRKRSVNDARAAGSSPAMPAATTAARHAEREHRPSDRHHVGARNRVAADGLQGGDDADGEAGAGDGADQRHDEAFGDHLAEQPRAARAERRSHRVFLLPLQAAREQQAGDVRAGDEEDERDRAEQRHQQAAAVTIQHVVQQSTLAVRPCISGFVRAAAAAMLVASACASASVAPPCSRLIAYPGRDVSRVSSGTRRPRSRPARSRRSWVRWPRRDRAGSACPAASRRRSAAARACGST